MMNIIDSHLHFFALEEGEYHWLKPDNPPFWSDKPEITKSVSETDLRMFGEQTLSGYVHVEAGFNNDEPWREIDWLEKNTTLPMRSVAGCNLLSDDFKSDVDKLLKRHSVTGVRHILDEDAAVILNSDNTYHAVGMLVDANYSFDAQLRLTDDRGIDALIAMCRHFPSLRVIVNHAGFPPASVEGYQHWKENLSKLSALNNVAIKLSGWEMTNRYWHTETVESIIGDAIAAFGPKRVMIGSNFPLCRWSLSFSDYWDTVATLVPEHLRVALCFENTRHWYRVSDAVIGV